MAKTMYVSPTGSATSPYDTWAKAATAIQTALNAVDAGGGNYIYVAPGAYNEALTDPASSGTSGAPNYLIGDTQEAKSDGGATHGKGAGACVVWHSGSGSVYTVNWDNPTDYWTIRGMSIVNETYRAAAVGGSGTGCEGIRLEDCYVYSYHFGFLMTGKNNPTTKNVIVRSILHAVGGSGAALYMIGGSTTDPTAESLRVCSSLILGSGGSSYVLVTCDGSDSGRDSWLHLQNCTMAFYNTYTQGTNGGTYAKITTDKCVTINRTTALNYGSGNYGGTGSGTNLKEYSFYTAAGSHDSHKFLMIPMFHESNTDALAAYNPTGDDQYDIRGTALSTSYGCVQKTDSATVDGQTATANGGAYEIEAAAATGGYVHRHVSVGMGVV